MSAAIHRQKAKTRRRLEDAGGLSDVTTKPVLKNDWNPVAAFLVIKA
jgi:hypothetical protein